MYTASNTLIIKKKTINSSFSLTCSLRRHQHFAHLPLSHILHFFFLFCFLFSVTWSLSNKVESKYQTLSQSHTPKKLKKKKKNPFSLVQSAKWKVQAEYNIYFLWGPDPTTILVHLLDNAATGFHPTPPTNSPSSPTTKPLHFCLNKPFCSFVSQIGFFFVCLFVFVFFFFFYGSQSFSYLGLSQNSLF